MSIIKNKLLEVGITNADCSYILEYVIDKIEKTQEKFYIVTPNPEILVYANNDKSFKEILNQARISLCDGVGVFLSGIFLGKPFKERVTGVNFMEKLCSEVSEKPITVGLLGGGPGIAEMTAKRLLHNYPNLRIVFVAQEWGGDGFKTGEYIGMRNQAIKIQNKSQDLNRVNSKLLVEKNYGSSGSIDILFVAFGFPKQEEWIVKNLPHLSVRVMMAVGGSFDYISGNVARAPLIIRKIGMEWLFRLMIQPWRAKRQWKIIIFLWLILKEWFTMERKN
ncbi:acetylglucosaminyldiphosphoundecaprenol acetyl-beta-D-mannosaminyltransferase [Candidatus Levyibacteriota bacterium]|nr:WecB/TagA/CpsF family glycosyltransferase [Candidatus Levybacteria bacterium]GDX62411.1 acetylglucosaminyldiphosphoundecaprenol acetyl-beta-D-mannosaminyltransferase [Candidatus Levybacteria bacterium]